MQPTAGNSPEIELVRLTCSTNGFHPDTDWLFTHTVRVFPPIKLKPELLVALPEAYQDGILLVVKETPLSEEDLPAECPYPLEQVLDLGFYPGSG